MVIRYLRSRILLAMVVGLVAVSWAISVGAAEEVQVPSKSSRALANTSSKSSHPSGGTTSVQSLEAKLNEILEKQQQIMARLDEVMSELQIVKVRATVR